MSTSSLFCTCNPCHQKPYNPKEEFAYKTIKRAFTNFTYFTTVKSLAHLPKLALLKRKQSATYDSINAAETLSSVGNLLLQLKVSDKNNSKIESTHICSVHMQFLLLIQHSCWILRGWYLSTANFHISPNLRFGKTENTFPDMTSRNMMIFWSTRLESRCVYFHSKNKKTQCSSFEFANVSM